MNSEETKVPPAIIQQFRSRRNPAIPLDMIALIYEKRCYADSVYFREFTKKLPSLRPLKVTLLSTDSQSALHLLPKLCPISSTEIVKPPVAKRPRLEFREKWTVDYAPKCPGELFGQQRSLQLCRDWYTSGSWKQMPLLLTGANGSGKTCLLKIIFPKFRILDFSSSNQEIQTSFVNTNEFTMNSEFRESKERAPPTVTVVNDIFCSDSGHQSADYLCELIRYFSPPRCFQVPLILVTDAPDSNFMKKLGSLLTRVNLSKLNKKTMTALGFDVIRRAGFSSERFSASIYRAAEIALNPRHLVNFLQEVVCGIGACSGGNTMLDPFERVHLTWRGKIQDARETTHRHWLAENTTQVIRRPDTLAAFCDDMSRFDMCSVEFNRSDEIRDYAVQLSAHLAFSEAGLSEPCTRDLHIRFPRSLHREGAKGAFKKPELFSIESLVNNRFKTFLK